MGLIIFIHGMGNNPNQGYWQDWGGMLLPYLIEQGIDQREIRFGGVYYYDLVPQPGDGWKKITSFFYRDTVSEMRTQMWHYIVKDGDIGNMLGRGAIDGLVNLVADNFGDIFSYLLNDDVYNAVNERFYHTLASSKEPVTLVAYSLGTMISYCALQQNPAIAGKLQHFVTLGSPIFWFRKWLKERVDLHKKPTPVHWTNLAGKLDVACPHLVNYKCRGPDTNLECELDKLNPVKGHTAYLSGAKGLSLLSSAIAAHWKSK